MGYYLSLPLYFGAVGRRADVLLVCRGKPETLLEQQGVFGLKTSSSHAFLGAEGAKYLWRKQSSSTPLSWEVSPSSRSLRQRRAAR